MDKSHVVGPGNHAPLTILHIKSLQLFTHGACSSVDLPGFSLSKCPGSSFCVYPALEGLAVVVLRGLVPPLFSGSTLYVHACHPRGALPAPGLAGCPVGRGE